MSKGITITLTMQGGKEGLWFTANSRLHWARRAWRTRSMRQMAFVLGRRELNDLRAEGHRYPSPVFGRAHVTAVIHFSRGGTHDPGNASPMVKAAVDGLTDAGYWVDDDSTHVVGPDYRIGEPTGRAGVYRIELEIEEES